MPLEEIGKKWQKRCYRFFLWHSFLLNAKRPISVKGWFIYYIVPLHLLLSLLKNRSAFWKRKANNKKGRCTMGGASPFFRCITALKTYTVLQKTYFWRKIMLKDVKKTFANLWIHLIWGIFANNSTFAPMIIVFEEEYLRDLYEGKKPKDKKRRYQPQIVKKYVRTIDLMMAQKMCRGWLIMVVFIMKSCMVIRRDFPLSE